MIVISIAITAVFIYFVIMVPIQYTYLVEMKKQQASKASQQDYYDDAPTPYQVIHYQLQSSPFFLPANLVASIIYRFKHG